MTQVVVKQTNDNSWLMDDLLLLHVEHASLKKPQSYTFTRSAQVKDDTRVGRVIISV